MPLPTQPSPTASIRDSFARTPKKGRDLRFLKVTKRPEKARVNNTLPNAAQVGDLVGLQLEEGGRVFARITSRQGGRFEGVLAAAPRHLLHAYYLQTLSQTVAFGLQHIWSVFNAKTARDQAMKTVKERAAKRRPHRGLPGGAQPGSRGRGSGRS